MQWLEDFAAAVRAREFDRGRGMFAAEAVGFGTVAERAVGLDTLVENQWRRVWSSTRDFTFHLDALEHGGEGPVFWAAAPWSSYGRDATGREVCRRGRATIVLARRNDKLVAVHSHFSFVPSGAVTPTSLSPSRTESLTEALPASLPSPPPPLSLQSRDEQYVAERH